MSNLSITVRRDPAQDVFQSRFIHESIHLAAQLPHHLLDTFDWNVSLFALTASGIVQREDVANIKAGGELWVQRLTYPRSTLRRGFRFSERFHMKFREGEIEKVCAEVAKQHAERQARKDGGAGRAE